MTVSFSFDIEHELSEKKETEYIRKKKKREKSCDAVERDEHRRARVEIRRRCNGIDCAKGLSLECYRMQAALSIKRQRERRDQQRRARDRRNSAQSNESDLTLSKTSIRLLDRHGKHKDTQSETCAGQGMLVIISTGILYIGVMFLMVGAFLLMGGLTWGDLSQWGKKTASSWWNALIVVGLFAIVTGILLIALNSVLTKKEEKHLKRYIQGQLIRSRSGYQLNRDVKTGGLITHQARQARQMSDTCLEIKDNCSPGRSPPPPYTPQIVISDDNQSAVQTTQYLERITEEEIVRVRVETSTANGLCPGSPRPSETRKLLQNAILEAKQESATSSLEDLAKSRKRDGSDAMCG
ncbi:hypothetical protein P5V15_009697 [Pogonomyrmex californicus]